MFRKYLPHALDILITNVGRYCLLLKYLPYIDVKLIRGKCSLTILSFYILSKNVYLMFLYLTN